MSFGDMQRMMRQVQKMQTEMAKIQEEVGQRTQEATAGGGAVCVTANGRGELVSIKLAAEALDPADPEMVADLVLTAANEALRRAHEMMSQELGRISGGLPKIPGLT